MAAAADVLGMPNGGEQGTADTLAPDKSTTTPSWASRPLRSCLFDRRLAHQGPLVSVDKKSDQRFCSNLNINKLLDHDGNPQWERSLVPGVIDGSGSPRDAPRLRAEQKALLKQREKVLETLQEQDQRLRAVEARLQGGGPLSLQRERALREQQLYSDALRNSSPGMRKPSPTTFSSPHLNRDDFDDPPPALVVAKKLPGPVVRREDGPKAFLNACRTGDEQSALAFLKGIEVEPEERAKTYPGVVQSRVTHSSSFKSQPQAHVNERDAQGRTPLHWAALRGFSSLSEALLDDSMFLNGNGVDREQRTALHLAAERGFTETALIILEHHRFTAAQTQDVDGKTALHSALKTGHTATAERLAVHPKFEGINAQDVLGQTALHHSAKYRMGPLSDAIMEDPRFEKADVHDCIGYPALCRVHAQAQNYPSCEMSQALAVARSALRHPSPNCQECNRQTAKVAMVAAAPQVARQDLSSGKAPSALQRDVCGSPCPTGAASATAEAPKHVPSKVSPRSEAPRDPQASPKGTTQPQKTPDVERSKGAQALAVPQSAVLTESSTPAPRRVLPERGGAPETALVEPLLNVRQVETTMFRQDFSASGPWNRKVLADTKFSGQEDFVTPPSEGLKGSEGMLIPPSLGEGPDVDQAATKAGIHDMRNGEVMRRPPTLGRAPEAGGNPGAGPNPREVPEKHDTPAGGFVPQTEMPRQGVEHRSGLGAASSPSRAPAEVAPAPAATALAVPAAPRNAGALKGTDYTSTGRSPIASSPDTGVGRRDLVAHSNSKAEASKYYGKPRSPRSRDQEVFKALDINRDGVLSREEFRQGLPMFQQNLQRRPEQYLIGTPDSTINRSQQQHSPQYSPRSPRNGYSQQCPQHYSMATPDSTWQQGSREFANSLPYSSTNWGRAAAAVGVGGLEDSRLYAGSSNSNRRGYLDHDQSYGRHQRQGDYYGDYEHRYDPALTETQVTVLKQHPYHTTDQYSTHSGRGSPQIEAFQGEAHSPLRPLRTEVSAELSSRLDEHIEGLRNQVARLEQRSAVTTSPEAQPQRQWRGASQKVAGDGGSVVARLGGAAPMEVALLPSAAVSAGAAFGPSLAEAQRGPTLGQVMEARLETSQLGSAAQGTAAAAAAAEQRKHKQTDKQTSK